MESTLKSTAGLQTKSQDKNPVITGIITGQIAGFIMAVVVMIVFALFLGKSPLYPVQVIGSAVFGESALQGFNLGALLAGLILHQLGPSLIWGLVFGVLASKFHPDDTKSALMIGLCLGVVSMVDVYLIVPTIMNTLHGVDIWNREVPMFWDWAAHIAFGASFALYPTVKEKMNS